MGVRSALVLTRLKKAIEKVKFLLSTNLSQWLYIGSAASATRRLSFRDDQPGLLDILSDAGSDDYTDAASSFGPSRSASPAAGILSRTISSLWAEVSRSPSKSASEGTTSRTPSDASSADDVDGRAEAFIANFWRHIQMERQVSLELRYCNKSKSLERTASG